MTLDLTCRQREILVANDTNVTEEIVHEKLLRGGELHGSAESKSFITSTPDVQVLLGTQTDGVLVTSGNFDELDCRVDAGR